jgi:hypothetical protein
MDRVELVAHFESSGKKLLLAVDPTEMIGGSTSANGAISTRLRDESFDAIIGFLGGGNKLSQKRGFA